MSIYSPHLFNTVHSSIIRCPDTYHAHLYIIKIFPHMLIAYLWFYRLQEILLILRFPRKYTVRFLLSEDYNKNLCIFPIFSFYISVFFSLYFHIFLSIFTLCIFPSFFSLSIFVTYRSLFSLYIFPSYI